MPFFFIKQIITNMSGVEVIAIIAIVFGLFGFLGFLGFLAHTNNVKNLKNDYLVIESQKDVGGGSCNIRLKCETNDMPKPTDDSNKETNKDVSRVVRVSGIGKNLKG